MDGFLILSLIVGSILTLCTLLKSKYNITYDALTEGDTTTVSKKQIILYCLIIAPMGLVLMKYLKEDIISMILIFGGTLALGFTIYVLTKRKILSLAAIAYPLLYFTKWNIYAFNIFAISLSIGGILLFNKQITWNVLKLGTVLITLYDIFAVFISKDMIVVAEKIIGLKLPVAIIVNTSINPITLGLGDIVLAGLLCLKYSEYKKLPIVDSVTLIGILSVILWRLFPLALSIAPKGFPATVLVIIAFFSSHAVLKLLNKLNLTIPTHIKMQINQKISSIW